MQEQWVHSMRFHNVSPLKITKRNLFKTIESNNLIPEKTIFGPTHNPILLAIVNNDLFLPFPFDLLKFSQPYQTFLHI